MRKGNIFVTHVTQYGHGIFACKSIALALLNFKLQFLNVISYSNLNISAMFEAKNINSTLTYILETSQNDKQSSLPTLPLPTLQAIRCNCAD